MTRLTVRRPAAIVAPSWTATQGPEPANWLKNVLASESATVIEGSAYRVAGRIVPASVAAPLFSPKDQRTHRLFRVEQCVSVRRLESDDLETTSPDPA